MAKITLDGKNPPAGKFQFELVDSNGSVVDRTTNDAGGNIIFKGHELEVKEAKYTIRLVDGDKNINYGETTKNVNVYLKDGEEVVDKYEGITNITSTDLGAGNIVVNYYLNGKRGTANAFCINTDVALNGNISLTPIKDPDDATLSKYIVQRFFDWKAEYQKANAKGDSTVVSYARRDKISRGWTFERYEYMPKTNSVVDEIKLEYNTDSISQLLRKALYYAQNNFSTEGVKVDRFRNGTTPVGVKIRSAAERYLKERINDDWVKQNMIWSVVGGNWGTRRVYYAYHAGKYPIMQLQEESDMLFPANFKTHMRKVTQNTVVPDNYHVMIFASNGNLSQPLAFGYFDDGKTKRRVKKTWLNVPNFECKSQKSVEVTKKWIGKINADSVNVTLKTTDGNVVESKRITSEDGWKATFGPYDKYDASGKEVKYNIDETKVDGYNSTITGDDNNGFVITNTETTKIKVVKKWFGKIADSITLVLKDAKTNKVIEERTINKADLPNGNSDTWEIVFEAPKYDSSKNEIKYTVEEAKQDGYTIKALCDDTNGHTIINIERKELKVIKKWIGPVGSEITINVRDASNNALIKKVTVDKTYKGLQELFDKKNNITTWIIPIEVDKYTDTGAEISYEVEEVKMPNYVGTVEKDTDDQFTIVNVPSVSFSGKKNWVNREGKPGQVGNRIIVHLMKEGSTQPVETKVLNKSEYVGKTTWDFTFKPVPLYDDNGREIKYYVEEEAVQGYEKAVITKDSAGNFVINNKEEHKNEKINIKVTKKWLNNKGEAGIPAGPIEIALKNGSKEVQKQTINLGADKSVWEFTFNDVDKYDDKNQPIKYSVTETALDGYETEITGNQDSGFVITNKKLPEPKEKIKIIKKWIGRVGDSITITIKNANTKEVLDKVTVTRNTKGFVERKDPSQPNVTIWEVPYEVNKFDASRTPIEYSAEETALEGYNTTVSKDSNTQFTITNTEKVKVKVYKTWVGEVATNATIQLLNGTLPYATRTIDKNLAIRPNTWEVTFDVPKYDTQGRVIAYTVTETAISGYIANVIKANDGSYTIVNTKTKKEKYKIVKNWIGKEGDQITVRFKDKATGKELFVKTIHRNDPDLKRTTYDATPGYVTWEVSVDLDKYGVNGDSISYTVDEDPIPGYNTYIYKPGVETDKYGYICDRYIIENRETVAYKVTKKWFGKVGNDITVVLKNGEQVIETKTMSKADLKAGTNNEWEVTFAPVEKYDSWGNAIKYSVEEITSPGSGYTNKVIDHKDGNITIINTENTEIIVNKRWIRKVGHEVKLKLMNGEKVVEEQTLNAPPVKNAQGWETRFIVPKYDDNGNLIHYTVTEVAIRGYKAEVTGDAKNGFTITNTNDEKVKVKVNKKWLGKIGDKVTLSLMEGTRVVETKTIDASSAKEGDPSTWEVSFEAPMYSLNGSRALYTVTEAAIEGYKADISGTKSEGFTITNISTEKIKIKVDKKWLGKVGSQITLKLMDGTDVVDTKTVDASAAKDGDPNTWEVEFEARKFDDTGREIVYTVKEETVPGYETKVSGNQKDGFTIANRDTEKIKIKVDKKWIGKAASEISISLMDGSKVVSTKRVNDTFAKAGAVNTWAVTFEADKYDENGKEIAYTVTESAIAGYDAKVSGNKKDGFTITNTNTEKVKIKVDKKWLGKVGSQITVALLDGTKVVDRKTVDTSAAKDGDAKTWEVSFEAPKYSEDGREVVYAVTESAIAGYKAEVRGDQATGFTILNKDTEKVKINVNKKWLGKVGSQITVKLMNGTKVVDTKTVDASAAKDGDGKTWELSFDADKYDEAGNEITYTVAEEAVPGYETKVSGNQKDGFTITNKDTEKVKIKVDKKWLGKVANEITVSLMNGTKVVGTKTVNSTFAKSGDAKTWEVIFEADKYDNTGKEIAYTVTESAIAGYEASVSGTAKTGFTIINKDTEKVKIKVDKKWLGGVADQVTISLMNGTIPYATKTIDASAAKSGDAKTWEVTFEAPKYNALGEEIAYTVTEAAVSGYKAAVSGDQKNGFTITNTQTGTEKFKVIKRWIGAEGDKITVRIKDADTGAELLVRTINKTDADLKRITDPSNPNITIWEVPVELDKFDSVGRKITYSVDEEKLPNYGKTIVKSSEGFTITNTEEVSFKVTKKWLGQVGNEITLTLKSGDKVLETKKVTSADLKAGTNDTWEVTFKAVPKYDSLGHIINYTVDEQNVDGYVKEITNNNNGSFTIINNEKTKIRVDKKWIGKVAGSVTIKLMNGTEVVEEKTVAKSGDAKTWEVSFEAPKYGKDGKEIAYTVTESAIAGYEASVSGNKNEGFTITNKDTEKVKIKVDKKWLGKVANHITVSLMNGNRVVESKTVNASAAKANDASTWEVSFDAAKYDEAGKEIAYTVTESAIAGYEAKVSGNQATGFTIVNKDNEKVKIKVDKKWLGGVADQVTISLMNGNVPYATKTVDASAAKSGDAKTWEVTFEAPKYNALGEEIAYTVTESAVTGYKAAVSGNQNNGFTITNTQTGTEKFKVIKKWIGAEGDKITVRIKDADTGAELLVRTINKTDADLVRITDPANPNVTVWEVPVELDKFDSVGRKITYSVDEENVPNYGKTIVSSENNFVITNTEEVSFKVDKKWVGQVGSEITVVLKSGERVLETKKVTSADLKAGTNDTWEVTFKPVPKYDAFGHLINYTVDEENVANYNKEITDNHDGSFTITNTEKVKVKVDKKWLGKVANEITVSLMNGTKVVGTKTVNSTFAKSGDAKTWEVIFEADKYDNTGKEIAYTVTESAIAGYEASVSGTAKTGFTIINKDTEKVKIKVDKKWLGGVADQVTISLMNGTIPYATKTIDASAAKSGDAKTWEVTFEAPKYNALGEEIAYTVTEAAVSGYKAAVSGDQKNGFTITNTQTGTEKFKVIKRWIGAEGDKITVRIKDADTGAELLVRTINKTDADLKRITDPSNPNITIWEVPVELDKFDSVGRKITYSVDEEKLPNYGKTIVKSSEGFTITNTEEVSFKVTKKWLGQVGNEITLTLKSGDKVLETKKVTSADLKAGTNDTWEVTFKAVPKYDSLGHIINYTVDEQNVDGYVKEITNNNNGSFTIINNEKTKIRVDKKWIGKVAGSVTIKLMNGTEVVEEKTVAKSGDAKTWEVSFEAPKYGKDGKEIAYTVTESAIAGYEASVSGNKNEGFTITNKDTEKVKIKVDKKWLGKVANHITVSLMNGNRVVESKTVNASAAKANDASTWEVSFDAAKYDEAGKEIAYTVTESAIAGYEAKVSGNQATGFTIVNKDNEKVKIKVDKKWLGGVADQVTISLMNGNVPYATKTVDASAAKSGDAKTWEVTFEAPKYDANGEEIAYTVKESAIAGYESNVSGNQKDGFTITNRDTEKVKIKVDKKWLGKVADEITVYLMNGASVVEEKTVNASAAKDGDENTWELTFEAPKYDKDGNEITYTVAEAALAGYTTEIVGNQNDGFVITNKENPTPNDEKVTIKVDKKWLGKVGDKITVSLMNGTQIVQVKTVDASAAVNGDQNTWELTFEAPKYDADHNEITYTVAEAEMEGYTTEISGNQKDGFVITNTEKPNDEKIKIRVDKRWLGKVAGEITVSVLNGDIPYATKTVTASAIKNGDLNTWEMTFDELPKYDTAGNEIAYTVTESAISGYSTTVEGDQNLGFTITNTETGCEHFKVIKKWVGAEGDKITIRIKDAETGKELYVRTVYKTDADITRKYLFDNQNIIVWEIPVDLDRFDSNGRKITYSVDEENIPNYGKTIGDVECGGVTITNTEMVSYKVTKKWYGKVGDEIIVSLKRGDAILETKTVTASALKAGTTNTWEVAFGTYPKYDGLGHEIKYTVDEQDVANYTKQVIDNNDGNITITNSENGTVKVTKKWDGAVGAFITLNIKDGDKVVATRVVTKAAVASGDATTWTTEFALPKYDETGKVIDYSVDEEDISGYTKTITGNTQDGFVVLNKEKPYTPDIPVIPPTPVFPDPQIPQDPQNPDPFEPQVPVEPDPTPKGVPTRPAVSTPDPKKPNKPGNVVTVDDDDTPEGRVVKSKKPKGKNNNIEVGDDNPPKGLPKTGSTDDMVFYANGCVLLLLAGLMMFKKKENK